MRCPTCKNEMMPALYNDNDEVIAWVCKCPVVISVNIFTGYVWGSQIWVKSEDNNFKQDIGIE